jgi:hypothetical protein
MLNTPSSTVSDYINNNNITKDDRVKIIETVEFYQNDIPCQNSNGNLVRDNTYSSCAPCAPSYEPKCDPCAGTKSVNSSWEWFGLFVLWFIALTVLFWLIYYSLKPPFVLQSDGNQVDTAKVLLAAVISAFVLIVIIWLIKAAMGK